MATLTGRAATDALSVYVRLDATGSRFDRRKVAAAVLTAKGRTRLLASTVSTRIRRAVVERLTPRPRVRSRRPRAGRARATRSAARSGPDGPGRPVVPPGTAARQSVAQGRARGAFRGRR